MARAEELRQQIAAQHATSQDRSKTVRERMAAATKLISLQGQLKELLHPSKKDDEGDDEN